MNMEQIKKLWQNTKEILNREQKYFVSDVVYGRTNELHYHHNLLVQIKGMGLFSEKAVYDARKCLYLMKNKFKKYGEAFDFWYEDHHMSRSPSKKRLMVYFTNKNMIEALFIRDPEKGTIYEQLIKKLENDSFKKINLFYNTFDLDLYELWNIENGWGNELEVKYNHFYSEKGKAEACKKRKIRLNEVKKRLRYVNSIDYEQRIFIRSGDVYSSPQWIESRCDFLKEFNKALYFNEKYIRYGIKYYSLDVEAIDIVIFMGIEESYYLISREGHVKFGLTRGKKLSAYKIMKEYSYSFKLGGLNYASNKEDLLNSLFMAYGMDEESIKKFYNEKWGAHI